MQRFGFRRIVLIATLLAAGVSLGACESFDPSEWFSQKKKLPGDRKEMFPGGVPGVPQGVPPELVEGYKPPPEPPPQVAAAPPVEEREKPKPKAKPKPRPKQAVVRDAPRAPAAAPPPQQAAPQSAWPSPQQSAGQPAPAQDQSVFPPPPPPQR